MMQGFRFYCQACETPPQSLTCVGGDDDLNLIVGWHCHVCNKPVLAKSPISYLFNLTVDLDDDDDEEPQTDWREVTEEDVCFLKGMRIAYYEEST